MDIRLEFALEDTEELIARSQDVQHVDRGWNGDPTTAHQHAVRSGVARPSLGRYRYDASVGGCRRIV
jgi:hypothetical protein